MEQNNVEFSIKDQIASLWLNRPGKRNAMDAAMLSELAGLFMTMGSQSGIRVLVIRGRGKVFSAGADLALMADISGKSEASLRDEAALFYDCFENLYRLPVPVVCYAHGGVHGGANGLLAASDFVLSTADTQFSFSEVSLGLVPATVAPFVLRRIGPVRTRQVMLTGEAMDGTGAHSVGLVDHLVEEERANAEIDHLVRKLKQNAPKALGLTKKMLVDIEFKSFAGELRDLTTELIARTRRSDEAREGLDAFFSKRVPNWRTME